VLLNAPSVLRKTPKALLIKSLLNPNHELMKCRFHSLSSLVRMMVGMKWFERQDFIP
jgi:hypothetical protein